MADLKQLVADRIAAASQAQVWTPVDFLDLGSRDAVDKALQRMVSTGRLRRLDRGLYDSPHLLGLALGAFPTSLNRSARDFASTVSRKSFGAGGATLDPSEPPERYCVDVFGTQARAEHRDPLGRRSTHPAGRPDLVGKCWLDDLQFRITDETSSPHETFRRSWITHIHLIS